MKNMNIRKGAFTAALATTISLMSLTGCTKKMDCDIEAEHAHIYIHQMKTFYLIVQKNMNILEIYTGQKRLYQ